MAPLGLLSEGERAEIVEIRTRFSNANCGCSCAGKIRKQEALYHAEDMGLREGKIVEILNNQGHRVILIKVDESRIALSRAMAMKIMVRRID